MKFADEFIKPLCIKAKNQHEKPLQFLKNLRLIVTNNPKRTVKVLMEFLESRNEFSTGIFDVKPKF